MTFPLGHTLPLPLRCAARKGSHSFYEVSGCSLFTVCLWAKHSDFRNRLCCQVLWCTTSQPCLSIVKLAAFKASIRKILKKLLTLVDWGSLSYEAPTYWQDVLRFGPCVQLQLRQIFHFTMGLALDNWLPSTSCKWLLETANSLLWRMYLINKGHIRNSPW